MKWGAEPLVRISIVGDQRAATLTRDDHGVVLRLLNWLIAQEIHSKHGGVAGGGQYVGYFAPAKAELVKAWLAAQPEFRSAKAK
jgi:hypothetical protein